MKTKEELIELLKTDINAFNKYRKETNYKSIDLIRTNLENAYLENANLENAYLVNANLVNANLEKANLEKANLEKANLYNAYLENAYLENANLVKANLVNANLYNANLYNANLVNANLYNANLENANLEKANLENANLENANLVKANLVKANLENANLYRANLSFSQLSDYQKALFNILPEGELIGYKNVEKFFSSKLKIIRIIIRIIIPKEANRLNALSSRKCRAEYALFDCLLLHPLETFFISKEYTLRSNYKKTFEYPQIKGEKIIPDSFDENNKECSNGIHFFITLAEAINY